MKQDTFYQWMKDHYDQEDLRNIAEQGCVSGCASGLIYYSETNDIYDAYAHELHDKLGEWIDEIGENPEFITKELGNASTFKNSMVWFVAEQYANEILQTMECEEESCE